MGKAQRDKGARYEREIVNTLKNGGFSGTERVPLSGAAGGSFNGDVTIKNEYLLELKKRKDGFKQLYKWLEGVNALVVGADRQPSLVVMPLDEAMRLWRMADERGELDPNV